ncbi:hypothetical protein DPV78_000688 [Talaromyces pinophilus]|nr:hypothetical protein DPV78_000688 [Talaromyces pinophilus]
MDLPDMYTEDYQTGHPSPSPSSGSGTSAVVRAVSELIVVLLGVGVVDTLEEPVFKNEAELGVGVLIAAVDTANGLDEVIATACHDSAGAPLGFPAIE